jgi:hypothetical protein
METIVYRQSKESASSQEHCQTIGSTTGDSSASLSGTAQEVQSLSPGLFYPLIEAPEMVTWTHWLPTTHTFSQTSQASLAAVCSMLQELDAPPAVLEEVCWAWKMDLFEAYEVRTPLRRDLRDPLLLGRVGTQRYRMALWGESLRPLEEMTALVQQSLVLRSRAVKWRVGLAVSGVLGSFGLGVWLGNQPSFEGNALGIGLMYALMSLFCMAFPLWLYTPESRQHDFLDRYRR